jgi:hypothetical protein
LTRELKFWEWFKKNEPKFFYLDDIENEIRREELLDEILSHLHLYCNKLYFLIGSDKKVNEKELIISAEGNVEYFDEVDKLVSTAPQFSDWVIIALKPPLGVDFVFNYEDIQVDVRSIWFLPLEDKNAQKLLGLRICFENFNLENERKYIFAANQILDTVLGERSYAVDINYVEVDHIPPNPED